MTVDEAAATSHETAALAQAASAAGHAPSIHNTQPWRWRIHANTLELYPQRERQLGASDPSGRMMVISCGAALHHARVSLAAEGWLAEVARLPDPSQPELLARITLRGRTPVTATAMRLLQTTLVRRTDRRPVTDAPVAPEALDQVRRTAEDEGARLHVLGPSGVLELATAAGRAQTLETLDPLWREEIAYWAGGAPPEGLGIPDSAIPREAPPTTVPGRDFGHEGTLPVGIHHDRVAVYTILYGDEDSPIGWLRGGEALSALWLVATEFALTVLPLSAAVEVSSTRQTLRRLLAQAGQGEPYLVLRLGAADPDHAGPPHTPRLPAAQTVEIV